MASQTSNLFSLARSKLHLSLGSKGDCSLHRWVLLKNSIVRSFPQPTTTVASTNATASSSTFIPDEEETSIEEESDSFMFPDAGKLSDSRANVPVSESEWLDSLLESLGDEDDEDDGYAIGHASQLTDGEEDQPESPLMSPMSSSDNLVEHPEYYSSPAVEYYPYPVPYPPFHPPLVRLHDYPSLKSGSPLYDDPLPHDDLDVDDLSVPGVSEDGSDDDSDAPTTPSLINSNSSSLTDSVSTPPLSEVSDSQDILQPRVYVDADESFLFNRLRLHPHDSFGSIYQEC
jgi:hypothetical protein